MKFNLLSLIFSTVLFKSRFETGAMSKFIPAEYKEKHKIYQLCAGRGTQWLGINNGQHKTDALGQAMMFQVDKASFIRANNKISSKNYKTGLVNQTNLGLHNWIIAIHQ